ncbi:MAG: hypothetical protein V4495_24600 [Pseudomonadota bacterium]
MLFPIKHASRKSEVFFALNELLGYFLKKSVNAATFNEKLFKRRLRDAILSNEPTRKKFEDVWNVLQTISKTRRRALSDGFNSCQNISLYYSNKQLALPNIDAVVADAFAVLSKHLFTNTAKLVDVVTNCGESIQDHFNAFRDDAINGNVCCCCGTEVLAQYRENVEEDDQWCAPYDHLLSQKEYPIFAVHPENLLPICFTCNSKAKLAKDLLREPSGNRRFSFFVPESAHENVTLEINGVVTARIAPSVNAIFHSTDAIVTEKLRTWDDVYEIKNRVEGEFSSLIEKLSEDFVVDDLAEFRRQLRPKADRLKILCRKTPWNFWKYKLYEWLASQNDAVIRSVWDAMEAKQDDPNAFAVYGI